jgi:hypothetical protein
VPDVAKDGAGHVCFFHVGAVVMAMAAVLMLMWMLMVVWG